MPAPLNVSPAFPKFFDGLLKKYGGSKQELAKEIGVSSAAVSHLAAGVMNPGVELCFRLAAATGVSAVEVLQASGKHEIAELIEALFGKRPPRRIDQGPEYSPDELELLAKLRLVRPKSRRALRTLIDAAAFANGALELPPGHTARRLVQTRPRGQRLRLKAWRLAARNLVTFPVSAPQVGDRTHDSPASTPFRSPPRPETATSEGHGPPRPRPA